MKVVIPTVKDVESIYELVDFYARSSIILKRSREEILKNINNFRVVKHSQDVVGCVSLYAYSEVLAELRTLVIKLKHQHQGMGKALVENIKDFSNKSKIKKLFTLTVEPEFFVKLGFTIIDKSLLPEKIFKDCTNCKYLHDCRETALEIRFN